MSKYVDLSERVTATYYDDEHEEWSQKSVTIADVLNSVCDEYTVFSFAQSELVTVNIDHELTQEEYEKLRKDMANAPIMLLPSTQSDMVKMEEGEKE